MAQAEGWQVTLKIRQKKAHLKKNKKYYSEVLCKVSSFYGWEGDVNLKVSEKKSHQ